MRLLQVRNPARGTLVARRARVADRWWSRLRGLLWRPPLREGEGLLLSPCRSVHTFGMRYPIDVAFLDRDGAVVAAYRSLEPRRASGWHGDAHAALELPDGTLARSGTEPGDVLSLEGSATG